jgi:hypothetical protein
MAEILQARVRQEIDFAQQWHTWAYRDKVWILTRLPPNQGRISPLQSGALLPKHSGTQTKEKETRKEAH